MAKREIAVPFTLENGTVKTGQVKVTCDISEGKGPTKVEYAKDMVHYLDYTGVALADLVDSAASADTVALQNNVWRPLKSMVTSERNKTTKMVEFYNRSRRPAQVDPAKAAAVILNSDMSQEALQALIAQLQAKASK